MAKDAYNKSKLSDEHEAVFKRCVYGEIAEEKIKSPSLKMLIFPANFGIGAAMIVSAYPHLDNGAAIYIILLGITMIGISVCGALKVFKKAAQE